MEDPPVLRDGQEKHGIIAAKVPVRLLTANEGFDDAPAVHDAGDPVGDHDGLAAGFLFHLLRRVMTAAPERTRPSNFLAPWSSMSQPMSEEVFPFMALTEGRPV